MRSEVEALVLPFFGGDCIRDLKLISQLVFFQNLSRLYYQYIPDGKEYPVLCRRLEVEKSSWFKTLLQGGSGKEEILLDWNEIAEQYGKLLSHLLV